MASLAGAITSLGLDGGIWRAYGDFSGKTEQVIEEPQGAPPPKKKRQQEYEQAWNRAKARKDIQRAIEATRQAEEEKTQQAKAKKKEAVKATGLAIGEIDQIASIQSDIDRQLAIEYQLIQMEWMYNRNKALALLLMLA